MATLVAAVSAGIAAGVVMIVVFGWSYFMPPVPFDRAKIEVIARDNVSRSILTDEVIDAIADRMLREPATREYLARHDSPNMRASIGYVTAERIDALKHPTEGRINPEFYFLPDGKAVIAVGFESTGFGIGIPERPRLELFYEPDTYHFYGHKKSGLW